MMNIRHWALASLSFAACACERGNETKPHEVRETQQASAQASQRTAAPVPALEGRGLVFVSNEGENNVAVLDASSDERIATIPVGKRPRGLRLSPDQRFLYVALSGSARGGPGIDESKLPPPNRNEDGIGVIDLDVARVVRTLPSGPDPESFDVSPNGGLLFVSNEDSASLSALDVTQRKIAFNVPVGREPEGVRLTPDGHYAYVACEGDNRIDVIDTEKRTHVRSIATRERPRAIVFDKAASKAYVSAELGGSIEVIDARKHKKLSSIALSAEGADAGSTLRPMGLVLSPDEKYLYVTTGRAGSVAVIDTASGKVSRTFTGVGARPWGIAISADGKKLFTANGPSDDVSVISTDSGAILDKVATGKLPWGVAYTPGRRAALGVTTPDAAK